MIWTQKKVVNKSEKWQVISGSSKSQSVVKCAPEPSSIMWKDNLVLSVIPIRAFSNNYVLLKLIAVTIVFICNIYMSCIRCCTSTIEKK